MLVTFEVGATFKKVQVPIVNDKVVEVDETFVVTLTADVTAHLTGNPDSAVLTINDDDGKPKEHVIIMYTVIK